MGTITAYGSKHSHEFKLNVDETSTSTNNNTSNISFSFTLYKSSYSWSNWNNISYTVTINGTSYTGTIPTYSAGSTLTIRSGTQTIAHDNDGTKSISYSFSVIDNSGQNYTCGNASASGSMNLTTIPRYANLTSLSVKNRTINSITLQYTTDRPSYIYAKLADTDWLNNGKPFASNVTSGTFTINYKDRENTKLLDPNTTYKITLLCDNVAASGNTTTKDITASTYDIAKITNAPNIDIGNSHTITWTNPSGTTTSLKLCKTDGTQVIGYGTVTGTSKTVTPTASTIYALTPNSNTITLRYIITTIANSTSYTNYKDCIFTVTNSNPTFSNFTYQDTNSTTIALTGNNQILVKGYSNVKGTVSTSNKATAKNSASMKMYNMVIGNSSATVNYSSSADVNMTINKVSSGIIDVSAIDSRGNSTKVRKTVTIKDYFNISIASVTAVRTNNVQSQTTLGFSINLWNNSFGSVANSITSIGYKYKLTSASSYTTGDTTLTYSVSGNKVTGSIAIKGDLGADGFNVENSYNIQLVVTDKLSTATYTIILGSGNPALAIYKTNVAIGQKYDTSDGSKLQVNGTTKMKDSLTIQKTTSATVTYSDKQNPRINFSNGDGSQAVSLIFTDYDSYLAPYGLTLLGNGQSTDNNGAYLKVEGNVYATKFSGRLRGDYGGNWLSSRDNATVRNNSTKQDSFNPVACQKTLNGSWAIGNLYGEEGLAFAYISDTNYNSATNVPKKVYLPNISGIISIPVSLYDNSSGTTGTVTLSETAANFNYLEIFYTKSGVSNSTRIYSPNSKTANLILFYAAGTSIIQNIFAQITISGTSITKGSTGYANFSSAGISGISMADNSISIYKVVGYK